jgi:hypothetical protein
MTEATTAVTPQERRANEAYDKAGDTYRAAARNLEAATLAAAWARICRNVPNAYSMLVETYRNEDGADVVRLRALADFAGTPLADSGWRCGGPEIEPVHHEELEVLADDVDPMLDWLPEMDGETYTGDRVLRLYADGSYTVEGD